VGRRTGGAPAEDAEVDLDEVQRFLTTHQLWNDLT
jgi:hypothetical protein